MKVEQSDLLSGYWVQYAVTGTLGTGDQKTQMQYNQLPSDSSLFPYKVQGKIPSSDREIMVSTYFAKEHNLSLNGKVTGTDVVESVSAPGTDKTAEYTIVGIFDTGFEGSTTNRAVFVGGTSLGEATLKAAETENSSSAAGYWSASASASSPCCAPSVPAAAPSYGCCSSNPLPWAWCSPSSVLC